MKGQGRAARQCNTTGELQYFLDGFSSCNGMIYGFHFEPLGVSPEL
jgi:hypothetical protein